MEALGIAAGILGLAAGLLLWRLTVTSRSVEEAIKARDEATATADAVRKESKGARDELEAKRQELADLQTEHKELKKKLYDSREEVRRRGGMQSRLSEEERSHEARIRELLNALETARNEVAASKKVKEEAERSLSELKNLREKVSELEAGQAKPQKRARPPRPESDPSDVQELRRRLADREKAVDSFKRKADNANRIYLVTKSQLDLAQEKLATLGLRYAEAVAKAEGRPPPLGAKKKRRSAAQEAADEAAALAEVMDETEVEASAEESVKSAPEATPAAEVAAETPPSESPAPVEEDGENTALDSAADDKKAVSAVAPAAVDPPEETAAATKAEASSA